MATLKARTRKRPDPKRQNGRIAPCGRSDLSTEPAKPLMARVERSSGPVRGTRPGELFSAFSQFLPRLREKPPTVVAPRGRSHSPTHALTHSRTHESTRTSPAAPSIHGQCL